MAKARGAVMFRRRVGLRAGGQEQDEGKDGGKHSEFHDAERISVAEMFIKLFFGRKKARNSQKKILRLFAANKKGRRISSAAFVSKLISKRVWILPP
jgi:hypothetical protein